MTEQEIKAALENAWYRWIASCEYARTHQTRTIFKHFCKYVVAIWNKADADAQLLQQFFVSTVGWSGTITPRNDPRMQHWIDNMAGDVRDIFIQSDTGISVDMADFLYNEYMRVGQKLAIPLHTQYGLAAKKLPEQHFMIVEMPKDLQMPDNTVVTEEDDVRKDVYRRNFNPVLPPVSQESLHPHPWDDKEGE